MSAEATAQAPEPKFDKDTLELYRRRMEDEIRTNFFKTVTLPIGGGGILAIFLAVIFWVPKQIDSFLKDPTIEGTVGANIRTQIDDYFKSEKGKADLEDRIRMQTAAQIKQELNAQLPKQVEVAVTEAVREHFATPQSLELIRAEVKETVEAHLARQETQDGIRKLVDEYMKTDGKQVLVEKVEEILRPAAVRVGQTISSNRERTVVEFEPQSLQGEEKGSIDKLRVYMQQENVDRIIRVGHPVVLTKTIKRGNVYADFAIRDYLQRFRDAFGSQFRHVAISWGGDDGRDRLLALVPARQFEQVFHQRTDELMAVLNAQRENAPPLGGERGVKDRLAEWFGADVMRTIPADEKVGNVLTLESHWGTNPQPGREVAVVDADGRLLATTSRRKLVDGLLK